MAKHEDDDDHRGGGDYLVDHNHCLGLQWVINCILPQIKPQNLQQVTTIQPTTTPSIAPNWIWI